MIGGKEELSQREMEVVACILIGEKTYKTTGRLLGISPKTVETHLRRVTEKYHCTKFDIRNIIGDEKLKAIYRSIENNEIKDGERRKINTKLLFVSVSLALISLISIGGHYYFKQDVIFNSNIKLDHNLHLIPRNDLIYKIENILKQQKHIKTVIISGVGGSGKTTLARSFINKQQAKVKWEIVAATEQELESSFRKLAKYLAKSTKQEDSLQKIESITDMNNRREELMFFISEIFKGISSWILLFDNVQNMEIVKKYLPMDHNLWGDGTVVITTKNSKLGEHYPFSTRYDLQMPEITPEEQFELFMKINKKYAGEIDKKKLKVFLDDIPRLPLDSAITAYYIKNTRIGFQDYLKYLQEYSDDFQKVQQKIASNSTNYDKTRFGIISSDFREIMKDNPYFKDLLFFISMLSSTNIKISLLKRLNSGVTVDNFLYELQRYSLVEVRQNFCNIHKFIHKVGFHYIITQFSEEEMLNVLDSVIRVMAMSYSQVQLLSLDERLNLSQHIESMIRKIDSLNIKFKHRYKLLLSNTLLHCYINFKPRNFIKEFAQEIVKKDDNILPKKELIKLLEICGNYNLISQDYDTAGKYLSYCLSVCGEIPEFQHMKAICLLDLAVLSEMKGDLHEAKKRRKQAFEFVNFSKENWPLSTELDLFSRFYRYYKELFVHSKEFQQVIDLGEDILKTLKADKFFYKDNAYVGQEQERVFSIRRYMIALYNKVGDFESALENVKECEFFFKIIKEAGIPFINKEATFRMREGYTFLRLNKLDDAERVLKRCIQVHKELGETPCIAQALLYLTEVLMRQNKLDEAYDCAIQALTRMDKASSNNDRFFKATCHYFLAVMELSRKKYPEALQHLNAFLNISNTVCKAMLDSKIYNAMVQNGVFLKKSCIKEMKNSFNIHTAEIFKNVYEPSHPFLKDFVYKLGRIELYSSK